MKKFNPEHLYFVVKKEKKDILYSSFKLSTVAKWISNANYPEELEILSKEEYIFRTDSPLKRKFKQFVRFAFLKKNANYERISNLKIIVWLTIILFLIAFKTAHNRANTEYTCLEKGTVTEITSVRYRTVYFKINNKYEFSLSQPNLEVGQETCIASKEVYEDEIKFHYGSEEIKADLQHKYE